MPVAVHTALKDGQVSREEWAAKTGRGDSLPVNSGYQRSPSFFVFCSFYPIPEPKFFGLSGGIRGLLLLCTQKLLLALLRGTI